jgi:hypothetical protein
LRKFELYLVKPPAMRFLKNSVAFLVFSLLVIQCRKESSNPGANDLNIINPQPIIAHLQGNITDEYGKPASGVNIQAGGKTAITDADGYFKIPDASLDECSSVVIAEKPGYFKGFRSFAATTGTNQVSIKLIKRDLAGIVTGSTGGDVSLPGGTKIFLKAGSIVVSSSGALYTGTVNIFAASIDPTAPDIAERIPGSFMANNADGSRVGLSSYGMVAVELEGTSGEKLQIRSGSTATLTLEIPASLQTSAPATIPMWYLDEQTGIWKEEGFASKTGNSYVTDVKHFTFWNCDVPVPAIMLSMTITSSAGIPLSHIHVRLIRTLTGTGIGFSDGWTDSLGQVRGLVPKNEVLQMRIIGPCGTVVHSGNIGPFSANTILGTIILPATVTSVVTVQGKLLTCAGTPVRNGYASVKIGAIMRLAHTDSVGNYQLSFLKGCTAADTAIITGTDLTIFQQSSPQTVLLITAITIVPDISACGVLSNEYLSYSLDGAAPVTFSIMNPQDTLILNRVISGGSLYSININCRKGSAPGGSSANQILFTVNSPLMAGTYSMNSLLINNSWAYSPSTGMTVTFTNYATAQGLFYEGSFTGTYTTINTSVVHTLTGQFRLKR